MVFFKNKSKESQENLSLFQWVNSLIPYVYSLGILIIVLWMLLSATILGIGIFKEEPMKFFLQGSDTTNIQPQTTNNSTKSSSLTNPSTVTQGKTLWFDYVIKPIVEPKFNQIIFKGVFLLFIWMLFFLVIPVAFKRLKKFKLFNMEFEVEDIEKAAIETVEISGGKAKLMAYLTGEDAAAKTIELTLDNQYDFCKVSSHFLEEIRKGYKDSFNVSFSYDIFAGKDSEEFQDLISESMESNEAATRNKENNENLFKRNALVLYFSHFDMEYTTVLTSYSYQFDVLDRYLILLLHNTISKNIENTEYMVELTEPPI
jgi:hypothetical protein